MATEYTIVYSQYGKQGEFFEEIAAMLKKGWSLQGGVSTCVIPIGDSSHIQGTLDKTGRFGARISYGVLHAQALVK